MSIYIGYLLSLQWEGSPFPPELSGGRGKGRLTPPRGNHTLIPQHLIFFIFRLKIEYINLLIIDILFIKIQTFFFQKRFRV